MSRTAVWFVEHLGERRRSGADGAVRRSGCVLGAGRQVERGGDLALMSFNVIVPTLGLALGLAGALLIVDALGWRAVAAMFDRERLITGTRS